MTRSRRLIEARAGLLLGAAMLALVVFGPLVAPYSSDELGLGPSASGPSSTHLLGLDMLGRDVFSRFLAGGRSVVLIPLAAVSAAFVIGSTIGLLSAYRGGWLDQVIERSLDVLLTLPPILIVLVVSSQMGTSRVVLVSIITLVLIPWVARVARGAAQSVVNADYIASAELRGEHVLWILFREVLPNMARPLISSFSLNLTSAIAFAATLSFLGLGEQPPSPDWGLAVAESRSLISVNPWASLAPALGIAGLATAAMLLSDAALRRLEADVPEGSRS